MDFMYHDPAVPLDNEERANMDVLLRAKNLRKPPPPHEVIALAAYLIWEGEGCPQGKDKQH